MGFLEAGTPMRWEDSEKYHGILDYVREHGVLQFLEVWNRVKDRKKDVLLWGDEVEFHLVKRMEDGSLRLSLRAHELLSTLEEEDKKLDENERLCTWHPEYGSWMIEATPSRPYGGFDRDLQQVEPNLRNRRQRIMAALGKDEFLLSMTAWPLMGVGTFTFPEHPAGGSVSESRFLPDACINPHPRFGTLTRNIRLRRGQKVNINVPLFKDTNTNMEECFEIPSKDNCGECKSKEIYMDSMGFGMGCCCLQVTFQARDLQESTSLYDQLAMLCPVFLALTAATPILKGKLADTDVRWSTIAQSVDCRTPVELGVADSPIVVADGEVPQRGSMKIAKSRYDSIDSFLSNRDICKPEYNDSTTEMDKQTYDKLIASGVDERLAQHIAHLFIRDPLVIFSERIHVDDKKTTEHFENIQSTNWQTMRWKPPPLNSNMGWRVEFRPMEMQLTDFENAAFTVVIVLLTRVILFFDLNLYIPISKVDENMKTAHKRDALLNHKFYFRKHLVPLETQCADPNEETDKKIPTSIGEEYELMTVAEILCGKGDDFPGLVPLIWAYLDIVEVESSFRDTIEEYIEFIVERARGEIPTTAHWMREFVMSHKDYAQDSVVSESIAKDLVEKCYQVSIGEVQESTLFGKHNICNVSEPRDVDRQKFLQMLKESNDPDVKRNRLRGASFHEDDVGMSHTHAYKCAVVLALIDKYKKMPKKHIVQADRGFAETPAFLSNSG